VTEDAAEPATRRRCEPLATTAPPAPWLAAAILVALVVFTYWPATRAGFVWDDDANVTQNIALRSPSGLSALWLRPGTTTQYYPVVYTSFWLEYRFFGLDPAVYHAVNILLHALGCVLLWRVLRTLAVPGAWLAAAVFAVHPVQVETVAWVTERKNLLSFVCMAAAMLVYLRRVAPPGESHRSFDARGYALAFALYLAALLSKVTSVTLGPALLVVLWWKRGRLRPRDVLPVLPMLVVAIPVGLLTRSLEAGVGDAWGFDWTPNLVERLLQGSRAMAFYLGKLCWPANLSFVYPRWPIDTLDWVQYLPAIAFALLTVMLFAARARLGRAPLAALLLYAGILLPVLGVLEVYYFRFSYVADHWLYVACIPPIALAVGGGTGWLARGSDARRRAGIVLAASWVIVLASLSWQRTWLFESSFSLFEDAARRNPDSFFTRYNYGAELQQRARRDEAMAEYRAALALDPDGVAAWVNVGLIHSQRGERERAIEAWERAVALDPLRSRAHWNLGLAWIEQGDVERGLQHLERSVAIVTAAPTEWARRRSAYAQLGQILLDQGLYARSISSFQSALELDPTHHAARLGLARALVAAGRPAAALEQVDKVLHDRPRDAAARRLRARITRGKQAG
jgi:tetratricopeptide (TPR) repeat protein